MSKLIGNVVVLVKVMKQFGVDILRLWVFLVDYQVDVCVFDVILKQVVEVYCKICNMFCFFYGNLFDFDLKMNVVVVEDFCEVD